MGKLMGLVAVGLVGCTAFTSAGGEPAPGAGGGGAAAVEASSTSTGGPAGATVVSSSSASSGATASSSSAGGGKPMCSAPAECPGADTACAARTCTMGACGASYTAAGKAAGPQLGGDCLENQCDGKGAPVSAYAPTDTKPDGNSCTTDGCSMQGPIYVPIGDGKCHAVCVVAMPKDAYNNFGQQPVLVGQFEAGNYATCGADSTTGPATPWKYTFVGVTWTDQGKTDACGNVNEIKVDGTPWTPFTTCKNGTACTVVYHAYQNGPGTLPMSWAGAAGVCE